MKYPTVFYELYLLTAIAVGVFVAPVHTALGCWLLFGAAVVAFTYTITFYLSVGKQISRELKVPLVTQNN